MGPEGYQAGTIIRLNFKRYAASTSTVPYQVSLDNGDCIYAPQDLDLYIRKSTTKAPPGFDLEAAQRNYANRQGGEAEMVVLQAPPRLKMGHEMMRSKKTQASGTTVPGHVWISDGLGVGEYSDKKGKHRFMNYTPLSRIGLSINNKDAATGKTTVYNTSDARTHPAPPDPVFAIEIPGTTQLGPRIDFLEYGNYEQANILSLDTAEGTIVSRGIDQLDKRPARFMNVPTAWVAQQAREKNMPAYLGGSTKHRCEILADVRQQVVYFSGKGVQCRCGGGQARQEEHHGAQHQEGCVHTHRPTMFLLHEDAQTFTVEITAQGAVGVGSFRTQPNGATTSLQVLEPVVIKRQPKRIMRAFLCAAECQDTSAFVGLFKTATSVAHATGRLVEFADATDRLNVTAARNYYSNAPCPGFDLHPYAETAFGYYAYSAGEAHEAAANLLSKAQGDGDTEEMRLAVASYKFGAYITSQAGAEESANYQIR